MKVTAVIEVTCPKCGDNTPSLESVQAAVRKQAMFTCGTCGRVTPMQQAVRLVAITGLAV